MEKESVLDALIPPCKVDRNIISRHPSNTKKEKQNKQANN